MTTAEFLSCIELSKDLLTTKQILEIKQLQNSKYSDICTFSYVKRRISQRNYIYIPLPSIQPRLMTDIDKDDANTVRNSLMNTFKYTIARNTVLLAIDLFCPNAESFPVIVNYGDIVQHQYITAQNCKIELIYPITVNDSITYEISLFLPQMKFYLKPKFYKTNNIDSCEYTDGGIVKGIYVKMPEKRKTC